jgi:hypothetical protein
MIGHGEKLSRKHEQAIAALLEQPTIEAAAKACGVGEATLGRWLQEDRFRHAYRRARTQVLELAISRLQQATGEAVQALRSNLKCGVPSVEVRAALGILEQAIRGAELLDVQERLEALEELLQQRENLQWARNSA